MGILGKWLYKTMKKARESEEVSKIREASKISEPRNVDNTRFGKTLEVQVTNVNGGKIVTVTHYGTNDSDRYDREPNSTTYIIHPDENFTESLAKLIAIEEVKL